jgi:hypothetical protein
LTPDELISKNRNLKVITPSGVKIEAFRANSKAKQKFQQVDLLDADGKPFASRFLRTDTLKAGRYNDIEVEWTVNVTDSAMVGSLIKSAYLALFMMFGYQYVRDVAGDKVRRTLAAFYNDKADKNESKKYFAEFCGSNLVVLDGTLQEMPDTLEGGTLMFHYAENSRITGLLFAVSCLFRVNDRMLVVTLPSYERHGFYSVAYGYYQSLLKDRSMRQEIYIGRFVDNRVEMSPTPMQSHYVSGNRKAV